MPYKVTCAVDGNTFRVVFNRPDMQKNSYQKRFGMEYAPVKLGEKVSVKVGEKVSVNERKILQLAQKILESPTKSFLRKSALLKRTFT